jgi:hypothetical protein
MLLSLIDGRPPLMENMQMPTELIVRGTTASPSPGQEAPGEAGDLEALPHGDAQ